MSMDATSPLRQRMIEDMNARKLCAGTQRGHIRSCKRFAAFLQRSPETASFEDIRRFQLHLAETGVSICTRNCIMTGLRFLWYRLFVWPRLSTSFPGSGVPDVAGKSDLA